MVFAQAIFKSQHEVDKNNGRDDDDSNDGNDDNGDDDGMGPLILQDKLRLLLDGLTHRLFLTTHIAWSSVTRIFYGLVPNFRDSLVQKS